MSEGHRKCDQKYLLHKTACVTHTLNLHTMRGCEVLPSDLVEILNLCDPSLYNQRFLRQLVGWSEFSKIVEVNVEKTGDSYQADEANSHSLRSEKSPIFQLSDKIC